MRPIEGLLSAANLIGFFSLPISLPPALRWIRYVIPIILLTAIAQVAVEGSRWQMIPAYLLTIAIFIVWLFGVFVPNDMHINRFIIGISVGLGVIGMVVSILLPVVLPIFHFPKPIGAYAIGTVTYHWVDASRPEVFTADTNDHREIMAQVWYPAENEPLAAHAPYIQDADNIMPVLAQLTHLPEFFFTHFKYVTTNAVTSAPIAQDQSNYPVLIFLPGLNGFRQMNTFQVEALVSQGYIVVGLDQPGAVALVHFPDGHEVSGMPRDAIQPFIQQSVEPVPTAPTLLGTALPDGITPYFAADVSFALNQLTELNKSDPNTILTGRLDLGHAGIFGISLGGMNAAEACLKDARLKACLIMDVFMSADVVKDGVKQPAMWITRDADTMRLERARAGGWTEKDIEQHQTTMRAVYDCLPGDGYYLQIPNMFHLNLTDVAYWSPIMSQVGMTGPVDGQRIYDIVNAYSSAFFGKYLMNQASPLLNRASKQFPEVNFETRRP